MEWHALHDMTRLQLHGSDLSEPGYDKMQSRHIPGEHIDAENEPPRQVRHVLTLNSLYAYFRDGVGGEAFFYTQAHINSSVKRRTTASVGRSVGRRWGHHCQHKLPGLRHTP